MFQRSFYPSTFLFLICTWFFHSAKCEAAEYSAIIPRWNVTLTPTFDSHGNTTALIVLQTISNFTFAASSDILSHFEAIANQNIGHITHKGVIFHDDQGNLDVRSRSTISEDGAQRIWTTARATVGDVHMTYTALPQPSLEAAKPGPALGLRRDGSGLMGSGYGFLALPLISKQTIVRTTLEWDLSNADEDVLAVSSLGGGGRLIVAESKSSLAELQASFFAVGRLHQAFPEPASSTTAPSFNIYWLTQPPFNISQLSSVLKDLYDHMRSFFHDSGSSFRVFLRHNVRGSLTGTALTNSFAFGWDDTEWTYPPTTYEREWVLAHEMAHNWVLLPGAKVTENWYTEGLAEYYSVLLRYRIGLISAQQYLHEINEKLTAYYTNPLVDQDLSVVANLTWNCSHAQRVPYGRGFAFGLLLDGLIKESTSSKHSLDDIVVELSRRSQKGETPGVMDFATLLSEYTEGRIPLSYIKNMEAGDIIIPPHNALDHTISPRVVRHDAPAFELGFDERSLLSDPSILEGLVEGSRAQEAGLQNGDAIAMPYTSLYNLAKDHLETKMILYVTRYGEDACENFVVEFWPRAKRDIEAYRYELLEHEEL